MDERRGEMTGLSLSLSLLSHLFIPCILWVGDKSVVVSVKKSRVVRRRIAIGDGRSLAVVALALPGLEGKKKVKKETKVRTRGRCCAVAGCKCERAEGVVRRGGRCWLCVPMPTSLKRIGFVGRRRLKSSKT